MTRISMLCLALLIASSPALGQRRTDVVTLYNGDRITGEVRSLQAGILKYKTDSMGTINIEWQDIANLQSRFRYEIRLSDGERLVGIIADADRPGQLKVRADEAARDLEWLQVVEVRPLEDRWNERLELYLAAGLSYNKASSVIQSNFNTDISYSQERALNQLTARHTLTRNTEKTTHSSRANFTRAVWGKRSHYFRSFWGSYESNDELGLEHRYAAGAGVGRFLIETYRSRWAGTLGLQLLTELSEGQSEEQALEAAIASNLSLWHLDTPELDLTFGFHLYPNLSDFGRLRGNTDLRLRWELIEDLFWDVTAWGTYDSDAESENVWDYGISTGIGWEY